MATIELVRWAHGGIDVTPWHKLADLVMRAGSRIDCWGIGEEWDGYRALLVSTADIRLGFVPGLCGDCFSGGE
jgi:hypothetical protein